MNVRDCAKCGFFEWHYIKHQGKTQIITKRVGYCRMAKEKCKHVEKCPAAAAKLRK